MAKNPFDELDNPFDALDQDRPFSLANAAKSAYAGVGNTADTALSTLAGSFFALSGDKETARLIEEKRRWRRETRDQWAEPPTFGEKLAGVGMTLPLQVITMGLSPAESALTAKESGESNATAWKAAGVDALGNAAAIALPAKGAALLGKVAYGGGTNAAQEYIVRRTQEALMETEKGQEAFSPKAEDVAIAGIVGGGVGVAAHLSSPKKAPKNTRNQLDVIKAAQEAKDSAQMNQKLAEMQDTEILNRLKALDEYLGPDVDTAGYAKLLAESQDAEILAKLKAVDEQRTKYEDMTNETQQLLIDDTEHVLPDNNEVIARQYGAMQPDGRVDENGMSIKADLSMEAQGLQDPLQMSLWGDELPAKSEQEAPLGMTQAMDLTRQVGQEATDLPTADIARQTADAQIRLFRDEVAADVELTNAVRTAETLTPEVRSGDPALTPKLEAALPEPKKFLSVGRGKRQRGALDLGVKGEGYWKSVGQHLSALTDKLAGDKAWQYLMAKSLGGAFETNADNSPMILLHGTTRNIKGNVTTTEQGFHAGFATSPHMFVTDSMTGPAKADYPGKPYHRADMTRQNGQLYPVAIKKGNYPYLPFDAGFWSVRPGDGGMFKNYTQMYRWLFGEYENRGYDFYLLDKDINYIMQGVGQKDINQRISDTLKGRLGIDGFFYKNEAESPHASKVDRAKTVAARYRLGEISTDPKSFVTWNPKNFASIYDIDPVEYQRMSAEMSQAKSSGDSLKALLRADTRTHAGALGNTIQTQPTIKTRQPTTSEVAKYERTLYDDAWFDGPPYKPAGPKSQGGMIDIDLLTGGLSKLFDKPAAVKKQFSKVAGKVDDPAFIQDDPDVDTGLTVAKTEKDGRGWKNFESGGLLTAMKRGSTAVKMAVDIAQNAFKRSDWRIRENVIPTERGLRSLSKDELVALSEVFKAEMFSEKLFDRGILLEHLSAKQVQAYDKMRSMYDDAWRIQNDIRKELGKKEITKLQHYLSSRWGGDYRLPVHDAQGRLVWYLAADTHWGVKQQLAALQKQFPDLVADPKKIQTVKYFPRQTDIESHYNLLVDILGRDDPAVAKIAAWVEDHTARGAAKMLAQEKHFEEKGNIRGFVGDRPEFTFFGKKFNSPESEAMALFQQQIQYTKNAYRWAEMQRAAGSIKKILSDKDLAASQPNNMAYIRDYWRNALGHGETIPVKVISEAFRDAGMNPTLFNKVVGGYKTYFILSKLAASLPYTAANFIALGHVLPHIARMSVENKLVGNPFTAVGMGVIGGLTMGTGHYLRYFGRDAGLPGMPFLDHAFQYAEQNGVTSRSIYDEASIESSFSGLGRAANAASKTMTVPETYVRAVAFMTYAQYLKSSGKIADDATIFKMADEATAVSMVDYRGHERPMMFSKLGSVGNALNVLQTFGWNYFQQWNLFVRDAAKGNPLPLLTMIGVQYMLAGIMGVPFADDIYKLYMWLKEKLPHKQYDKVQESEFLSDPKLYIMQNAPQLAYGVLSDELGVAMTSRLSAPSAGQMLQSPLGPPMDIAKQLGAVGSAAMNPTNTTKLAQAGMAVAPAGLAGALETAPFMEGHTYDKRTLGDGTEQFVSKRMSDLEDHRGVYARSQEEQNLRAKGFRSQAETRTRDATYSLDSHTKSIQRRLPNVVDKFYDHVKNGRAEEARELNELYVKWTGKGISNEQITNQILDNYKTQIEKAQGTAKSITAIKNMVRMQKILEDIAKDNPQ